MLQLENMSAGYRGITILRNVSFEVRQGEVVTIIGTNGAGKTTTLRTIAGSLKDVSGSILFDDQPIIGRMPHEIVDRGITLVPEGRQLFPAMSVRDNLLMGAYSRSARAHADETVEEVLALFPRLGERLDQMAGSLSGGEQQMVAIARGLMARPKLLMFDEPSLGLAPLLVAQVFEILQSIVHRGVTVLIVEQNIFHTLKIADRGYVLENGEITLTGTGDELLNNDYVQRAYLGI